MMKNYAKQTQQDVSLSKTGQKLSKDGRIVTSRVGWAVRVGTLAGYFALICYFGYAGLLWGNLFILFSVLMPLTSFITLFIGWFFYRNPTNASIENSDLVSIVIPVYNQESLIRHVIDVIYSSTYKNFEVVVVNDGSKDATKEVLDKMSKTDDYPNLKIIHKKNEGKRRAVAAGFYESKGKYIVFIDSDSIVDKYAIEEFVKCFESDTEVGGAVGHVKVLNARKNFLTKCQDAWYDFSFNILRTCESRLDNVTCLAGCLAAYRREAIQNFIPYWAASPNKRYGTDRELTSYLIAPKSVKTKLRHVFGDKPWVPISQKLMESMAKYDDSEDRALTAHSILDWKSVYVASALAYTDAPETLKQFSKQQIRWKKGYMRANFFVSSFFWRKPPAVAFLFYMHFMSTMITPLANFATFFYVPIVLGNWMWPITVIGMTFVTGFVEGLDYKCRDPRTKNWIYKPFSILLNHMIISWLIFAAIVDYRKNVWKTR